MNYYLVTFGIATDGQTESDCISTGGLNKDCLDVILQKWSDIMALGNRVSFFFRETDKNSF